jgi:hypothetical protein
MKEDTRKSLTSEVKQVDIVVLSVALLGGGRKSIDTEDIAIKSHQLSPGMFSWRKYPEQINLELVRVALSDAKKKQNGTLLQGSGREGWRLTSKGLAWNEGKGKELLKSKIQWNQERRQAGSVDSRRLDREKVRIHNSRAWISWTDRHEVPISEARELFRIDGYSTKNMLETKIVRLQSLFVNDKNVFEFLKYAGNLITEAIKDDHE